MSAIWERLRIPRPPVLPLRAFLTNEEIYTVADWHEDARQQYPVRYLLTEYVPRLIRYLSLRRRTPT